MVLARCNQYGIYVVGADSISAHFFDSKEVTMTDFEKILSDAKILAGALDSSDTTSSNNMFENMAKITSMMDILNSFRSIGNIPEHTPAQPAPVAHTPNNINALMAIAPYMGEGNQKNVMIASKLMELMHFVNNFEEPKGFHAASDGISPTNNRNMLLAARPYIEVDKRDMVDLLITVMDISEILGKIERMNVNGNQF